MEPHYRHGPAITGKPSTYLRCMLPVPFFPSSDLAEVIEFLATLYPSCLYRLSIRSSRATCTVTPRPVDCWPDWISQRRKRKDKETTPERKRRRFKIICDDPARTAVFWRCRESYSYGLCIFLQYTGTLLYSLVFATRRTDVPCRAHRAPPRGW